MIKVMVMVMVMVRIRVRVRVRVRVRIGVRIRVRILYTGERLMAVRGITLEELTILDPASMAEESSDAMSTGG